MPVATSCVATRHASGHIVRVRCTWAFPSSALGRLTVYRTGPSGQLQVLRTSRVSYVKTTGSSSYAEVDSILVGTGTALSGSAGDFQVDVVDYEPPQGYVPSYYFVATQGATTVTSGTSSPAQPTRGGDFLYDLADAFDARGIAITVAEAFDLESRARDNVLPVLNRRSPVVVRDLRPNPTAPKLTLITDTDAQARAMRAILYGGNPLCLSPASAAYGLDTPLYFVAGDIAERRASKLGIEPTRYWDIDAVIVDPPPLISSTISDGAFATSMASSFTSYSPVTYSVARAPFGLGMAGVSSSYDPMVPGT